MTAKVTGLKVLKNYVYADVELGFHKDSGRVTTTVRMRADDDDVKAALQPLFDLAAEQATTVVRTADFDERIDDAIRERVDEASRDERERVNRNFNHVIRSLADRVSSIANATDVYPRRGQLDDVATALRGITGKG